MGAKESFLHLVTPDLRTGAKENSAPPELEVGGASSQVLSELFPVSFTYHSQGYTILLFTAWICALLIYWLS